MMKAEKYIKNAKKNLYLLTFLDIADRLDILILEVRHLQQSVINALHAPSLYLPLRYEEHYIFGGWDSAIKYNDKSAAEIANESVIRYPSPNEAVTFWSKQEEEKDKVLADSVQRRLLDRVGEIWTGDVWVRGERQHYYALCALQILKQQIFCDKVRLFEEAKRTNIINEKNTNKQGLKEPAFLILGRGIHYRIKRYISSLKTQQQNFGKSLDFGLQRYPRPSIDRRREIGIFNDFLTNRTIDLSEDTLHLIKKLVSTPSNKEDRLTKSTPMLLHGWSQSMSVHSQQLWDNVGREVDNSDHISASESSRDISYIDTSFWSPDRPDLQPLVARAIAYSAMRGITKGYSDDYFSNEENSLTHLWVNLSKTLIEETNNKKGVECIHKNSEHLMRRLMTDCLAVSVKGVSYLYALFLAITGEGLENLLRVERIIRLEEVYELEGGIHSYEEYYTWYFRLKFTAFWLEECSNFKHSPLSSMDKIVLSGVNQVCEEVILFLDTCSIKSFSARSSSRHQPAGQQWQSIYQKLEEQAKKSDAIKKTREWRACRSRDTWDESRGCSGEKVYHRSTMRLDIRLQNFLFRETIKHKQEKNKPLYAPKSDDPLNIFCEAYGLTLEKVNIPYLSDYCEKPKNLYRQLHDIPFQCSVMRSMDILGCMNDVSHTLPKWSDFVEQAHNDMGLGREIFSFALEFYTWGRESPKSRLLLCINLLSFLLPLLQTDVNGQTNTEKNTDKLVKELNHWIYAGLDKKTGANGLIDISKGVDELVQLTNQYTHRQLLRKYAKGKKGNLHRKNIKKLAAIQVDDAFSHPQNTVKSKRRLEQLSGYKIKELLFILNKHVQDEFIDNNFNTRDYNENIQLLGSLREFLRIRDDSLGELAAESKFYQQLLHAFGGHPYTENGKTFTELPELVKPIIVTRFALTSYYAVANAKKLEAKGGNINGYGLGEILERNTWEATTIQEQTIRYSVLLGRYDIVSFAEAKLPCRCHVNYFDEISAALKEDEKFATHFSRREIAIPIPLYGNCDFNDKNYTIYAISSISLQRRSMRLNLIYRLLNSCQHNQDQMFSVNSIEARLNAIINPFKSSPDRLVIKALLTDGWGDLLLVLMCKRETETKDLHDNLLKLQQAIYEDFMVDRTELIYTPQCLDHMASDESYTFSILFRFLENRKLERCIQNFVEVIREKKASLAKEPYNIDCDAFVTFTPGQYDVKVSFYLESTGQHTDIYKKIIQWFADKKNDELYSQWYKDGLSFIDKIETSIERRDTKKTE